MFAGYFNGYPIYVSDKPLKKYYAIINNKKVYFGDVRYQHYYDKMGYYKALNHLDAERRRLYLIRHRHNKDNVGSPGWFSAQVLW